MKKKPSKQSDSIFPRLICRKTGEGEARWSLFRFNDPSDDQGYKILATSFSREAKYPFREKKRLLKRILREEGFPPNSTEGIPSDEVPPICWFAAAILGELAALERGLEIGDAHGAAVAAYRAGYLDRMAFDKFKDEKNALLGTQGRGARRRGGDKTGERTTAAAKTRNAEVLRLNTELAPRHPSERGRAAIIARTLKRPVATVRDILKRSK